MLRRIRRRIGRLVSMPAPPTVDGARQLAFAAELPVGQDLPLWRVQVQMVSEPHADGERLRLRAHLQTNFASALRPALQQDAGHATRPAIGSDGRTALSLAQRAGGVVQRVAARALDVPALRTLAEPLLQLDLNSWVEVQASTASLADGSHQLLPQQDKLAALGIRPKRAADQPVAESWAGEAPDGFAQVSVLQIDKRHLPERLRQQMGERPFSLAAAIVNTAQQK
ncbi:MAG: hypothetical protein ACPGJF_09780 [Sinimarinibacterium flocculans]|uniref:Uncharacterized protein n=2 Tax=Sinimarinibacterium flocculans TaxID=985250 RepID=A0A318EAE5_9GAMM|nr:hypothetical protein C8D93_10782 [Sinimarinibacterium flocculans]